MIKCLLGGLSGAPNIGFGLLWPLTGLGDRSDWSVLTVTIASFCVWSIYTPQPPLLWAAGSLTFLELLESIS